MTPHPWRRAWIERVPKPQRRAVFRLYAHAWKDARSAADVVDAVADSADELIHSNPPCGIEQTWLAQIVHPLLETPEQRFEATLYARLVYDYCEQEGWW